MGREGGRREPDEEDWIPLRQDHHRDHDLRIATKLDIGVRV